MFFFIILAPGIMDLQMVSQIVSWKKVNSYGNSVFTLNVKCPIDAYQKTLPVESTLFSLMCSISV